MGFSFFLIVVFCFSEGDGMVIRGCGEIWVCEEGFVGRGLLGVLDCVEFGGLFCEVDVWGGEGEEEMEDGDGFFMELDVLFVEGGCDVGGCDCGVFVGFFLLVFFVFKNKMFIL